MISYFEKICAEEELLTAWEEIKPNLYSSGIDNVTAQEFENNLIDNITDISERLKKNEYVPKPLLQFKKYEGDNKFRDLNIASIEDRIIQKCFVNQFTEKTESYFYELSYAYRKKRGHKNAIHILKKILDQHRYKHFVTGDILKYFDNIDHDILISKFEKDLCSEPEIVNVLKLWIKCPYLDTEKKIIENTSGIAQGMVISPFLSNVYLDEFDHSWSNKEFIYIRYADNFIFLAKNEEIVKSVYENAGLYLKDNLKLELNVKQYNSGHIEKGFGFLGIWFGKEILSITKKKISKINKKIKYHINKAENVTNAIESLNKALYSWRYYYSLVEDKLQLRLIDDYIILNLLKKFSSNTKDTIQNIISDGAIMFLDLKYDKKLPGIIQNLKNKIDEEKIPIDQIVRENRKYYKKQVNLKGEWLVLKHGTKISLVNKKIRLESSYGNNEVPISSVTALQISSQNNTITTNLIESLAKENIPIYITNNFNLPIASILPSTHSSLGKARKQIEAFYNGKALFLLKEFIKGKIKNQLKVVRYYSKYWKHKSKEFETLYHNFISISEDTLNKIDEINTKDLSAAQDKVLGYEGYVSKEYWKIFGFLIYPVAFDGRKGKDAHDIVNIMLNYGYGILYNRIHNSILKQGLNPQISYLHREQKNKPTLVFDIIEQFRAPAVERAVIAMLNLKKKIELNNENRICDDSKKILANYFLNRLHSYFNYKNNETSIMEQITTRIDMMDKFLHFKSNYSSFVMKS